MKTAKDRAELNRAYDGIAALKDAAKIETFGPEVIKVFAGLSHYTFMTVDERGGNCALPKTAQVNFWMVRTVRNNRAWCRKLFEVLTNT